LWSARVVLHETSICSSASSAANTPPESIEMGAISFVANVPCLYPTYIRVEAYLAA
jgi:hypothetical protein